MPKISVIYIGMHTLPDCPFCLDNQLLKTDIIAETDGAYLIDAYKSPGCYLIIPKVHAEKLVDLPDDWWQEVKQLLSRVPDLPQAYNLAFNVGAEAGQTIQHLHLWVIPRTVGKASSGKGLARLIGLTDQD